MLVLLKRAGPLRNFKVAEIGRLSQAGPARPTGHDRSRLSPEAVYSKKDCASRLGTGWRTKNVTLRLH